MAHQIAFLRAVNLAGRGKVAMANLRQLFTSLGFEDVRTILQTGNVIFEGVEKDSSALEEKLEKAVASQLSLRTEIFVRSAQDWRRAIASNPFPDEAVKMPGFLVVMLLKTEPDSASVIALRGAIKGRERIEAAGRQLYIVYPDGIGRSKLTSALIERKLGTRSTGRNWNTALRIAGAVS